MRHHGLLNSIVINRKLLFTSKFWSSLFYFLGIKQRLSTAFHLQIDSQTKRQNSTIKAYFQTFVNFEQDDWVRLLLMIEFTYNNAKNTCISHILFELNCGYHSCVFYKENLDPCSKSRTIEELFSEF